MPPPPVPGNPVIDVAGPLTAYQTGYHASVASQPNAHYAWQINNGLILSGQGSPAITFQAGASGVLALQCLATNAAGTGRGITEKQVHAGPTIIAPDQTYLHDGPQTAVTTPMPGVTYLWSIAGGEILSGQGTPSITFVSGSSAPSVQSGSRPLAQAAAATPQAQVTLAETSLATGATESTTIDIPEMDAATGMPPSGLYYDLPGGTAAFTRGVPIGTLYQTCSGPVDAFSVAPALPAGLALDPATGYISGTPTMSTPAAAYVVTAANAAGSTTATLVLSVRDVAPANLAYGLNPAVFTLGSAIAPDAPTSSGDPARSYAIAPALPAGLGLDPATGIISGTPAALAAPAIYTVTATNTGGSATASVDITVDAAGPAVTYTCSPAYPVGQALSIAPASTGGAVVSFRVSPALPAGLALNAGTGVISGTPTALAASTTYTITATNSGGTATPGVTFAIVAAAPAGLSYGSPAAVYTKGTAIPANSPSSSGGAVVSYSVSPALPAGLTLDAGTGVISGTPTALAPAANYTVTATNTGGSATATLDITVDAADPSVTYTCSPTYTVGQALSITPANTGGTVVSYRVSPALPPGLALNAGTGVIAGTPTALAVATTYTITAANSGGTATPAVTFAIVAVPPAGLAYGTPTAVYTKGTAITANSPSSSGGAVVSYGVSPALPAGLALDPGTGVLSGTPTALAAPAIYTVTATNTGGSATASLDITVDAADPSVSYTCSPTYPVGQALTITPASTGGAVVSYRVSPALPPGLALNAGTGVIAGTPTALAASTTYTVTATNTGGTATPAVTFAVVAVPPAGLSYGTPTAVYTRGTAIIANSPSSSGGAVVSYSVSPSLPAGLTLDTGTGVISGTPTALAASASYTVTAGNSGGSTAATVNITVNDAAPAGLTYSSPVAVYSKGANIADNNPSSTGGAVVSYGISPALPAGLSLNTGTGVISGNPSVLSGATSYTVTASNTGGSTTATVNITVNDVAPGSLSYSSQTAVYTRGTAITPDTPSSTGGTVVSYAVSPALPAGLALNTGTGVISGTPTALAAAASYTVTATGTGGNTTTTTLTITVNDVAPSSLSYGTPTAVYTRGTAITANSPSSSGGAVVSYGVSPALPAGLALNAGTGVISGTPTALAAAANYTVTASNTGGSAAATVTLTVNDVAPASLSYGSPAAVYTKGTAISANSPSSSGGAVVAYGISPALPALTGLSFNTGTGVISGTPSVLSGATTYTVTASNSGGSTIATVTLTVNDAAPASLAYGSPAAVYTKGTAISANSPSSAGGAVVAYSISPALSTLTGLSFNTATGVISGNPSVLSGATGYTVTASNTGGSTTATVNITVNDVAPASLSYSSPAAVYALGANIADNSPSSTGGAVVSYSVSPALPAGLTLGTGTGVISGSPAALAGAANYTVTAANSGGSTTATVNLTVNDVAPSSLSYSAPTGVYTKGTAIAGNSPSSSGGAVVSYGISPALPAGLALNTVTGVISGTPTALAGAANYTVTATNTGGSTTATVNLTVNDVAPSSLSYSTPTGVYTKGSAIAGNSPSSSGGAVVSYGISPALPAGLALNTGTGVISGTPSALAGAANYTVTATNTGGSTAATVVITVNDVAPAGLSYSLPTAAYTKGANIAANSPSSSGGAVVSYSVGPSLPAGLSLSTGTGVISGNPTALAAAANYTVTATNSGGSTTAAVNIAVNDAAPVNLAYGTPTAVYTKGTAIAANSPSSSGGAVVSYGISPALPAGLTLNTGTGVISGTPAALATAANYTVTATNTGGSATATVNLTVNDAAPSGLSYNTPAAVYTKGSAITGNSPSSAGGAVVSYGVSPALPAGLALNTGTGVISGTPTALAAAANYTVTASNTGGSTLVTVNITVNDVAPAGLSYSTPTAVYTKGANIADNGPSSAGGAVVSYGISPALPAGLTLNTGTGVISGTPTALAAAANHTVTATNTGGSATATVNITVNDAAPASLSYSAPAAIYTKGMAITANSPSSSGGAVVSYGISPALPAGLALDTGTGVISGTPTTLAAAANYTVTATNTGGGTSATVNLTVDDVAPSGLTYSTNPATYSVGTVITANSPSISGGPVTSYAVSPSLPAGLSLNAATGVISGTPTDIAPSTAYTVTASNSGGSASVPVTLQVNAPTVNMFAPLYVHPYDAWMQASVPPQSGDTYQWTLLNGTATGTLTSATNGSSVTFFAGGGTGTFQLQATVTNSSNAVTTVTRTVTVQTGTWLVKNGGMSVARAQAASVVLLDGRVLVAGGYAHASASYTASAEIYDPVTNTWTSTGSMTLPRAFHTATLLSNGAVLVAGGLNSSVSATSSVEIYDPVTGTWTATGSMASTRTGHTATLLAGGTVLVTGGLDSSSTYLNTTETFNPSTGTWSSAGTMSSARLYHSAVVLGSGKVLVIGGASSGSAVTSTCDLYDPSVHGWSSTATLTTGRDRFAATLLGDGTVMVAGGTNASGTALSSVEIYNPSSPGWSAGTSLATARCFHTLQLLGDGSVLATGGINNLSAPSSTPYLLTSERYVSGTWSTYSMNHYRANFCTALLGSGKVLAMGGYAYSTAFNGTSELFDPTALTWTDSPSGLGAGRYQHASTTLPAGKVLVTGGVDPGSGSLTAVAGNEIFNPTTCLWTSAANTSWSPRYDHTSTLLADGKVLVAGGFNTSNVGLTNACLYDPAQDSAGWSNTTSLNIATYFCPSVLMADGTVLVPGGPNYMTTAPQNCAQRYDPNATTWTTYTMASANYDATAVVLGEAYGYSVLLTGGYDPVYNSEAFVNSSGTWSWTPTSGMIRPRDLHGAVLLSTGNVLVAGGSPTSGPNALLAEIYTPSGANGASGSWASAGNLTYAHAPATVLNLGGDRILVAGGEAIGIPPEIGIPSGGTYIWSATAAPNNAYSYATVTLLPNGQVMISKGLNIDGVTEIYQP